MRLGSGLSVTRPNGLITPLRRLLALQPSLLIWPAMGAGWQGTSGGTLAASGQPLGLGADLSQLQGKTLSEWLASAANIRNTGATGSAGTVGTPTYNTSTGEASLPRVDGANQTFLMFADTGSKTYAVEINNTTANAVTVRSNATVLATISGNTTSVAVVNIAAGQVLSIYPSANGVTQTLTVNSVRELPGNHLRAGTWASPSDAARANYVIQTDPALYNVSGQPELVTNGDFATDTAWTKGTGWTISGGAASINAPGANSNLFQSISAQIGDWVLVTATVTRSAGQLAIFTGSAGTGGVNTFLSSATQTRLIQVTGAVVAIYLQASASFIGTVESVSCKVIPASQYKYALSFGGVDDYYSLLNAISITTNMTVVRAFKRASAGIRSIGIGSAANTFPNDYAFDPANAASASFTSASAGTALAADTTTGSFVSTSIRNAAASKIIRRNGVEIQTEASGAVAGSFDQIGRRGGGFYNSGEISFLALFPTELTGADLALVEQIAAATNGAVLA